ncbi:hypothetical protein BDZ97DRAFT_1853506 [Flammula alnicola]|nr:hypothetical protein BDZ97DRAFT_1853506 [Flammula alnicola]
MPDLEGLDLQALMTNEVFPDDERNEIKSQREAARTELALLDAEIALVELDFESDTPFTPIGTQMLALIAGCNVATAPQKYLPAELLSHIFTLVFNAYPTSVPPPRRTSSPLSLCHTCSRWRKVALDTPELWSDVVFRYSRGLDPHETMIGASKPLFLEISPRKGEYPADHEQVMQTMLRKLLRLPEAEIYTFLTVTDLSFPLLKSLRLIRDSHVKPGWEWSRTREDVDILFKGAPELTDVEVHNLHHCTVHDIKSFFLWTNITRFHCHNAQMSVSHSHAILRQCHRLVECGLSLDVIKRRGDAERVLKSRIELPFLRTFSVTFGFQLTEADSERLASTFFEPLFIPNVKELNVDKADEGPMPALTALLSKSCHDIEILQLQNITLTGETVAEIIRALHSLAVFLIGLENLIPRATLELIESGDLLPKLRCLACRVDRLETAIRMLEKRWEASAGMDPQFARPAFFMLDYIGDVINHDQAVRVDRLRANGVEINMTHIKSIAHGDAI